MQTVEKFPMIGHNFGPGINKQAENVGLRLCKLSINSKQQIRAIKNELRYNIIIIVVLTC